MEGSKSELRNVAAGAFIGLSLLLSHCGGPDQSRQLPEISTVTTVKGPAEGPVTGGTAVTIRGRNLGSDALVFFGGVPASTVKVLDFETIVATPQPVFLSGPTSIIVISVGQTAKKTDAFTFTPVIAFTSNRDGDNDIYLMDIDSKGLRPLTINTLRNDADPTSLISDERPRFSYDGQSIAFESNREGNFDIYITDRNGFEPTPLSPDPAVDQSPAFSPEGTELVFISKRKNFLNNPEEDFEIFLVDRAGSNLRQLTENGADDRDPRFSPDGGQIVFSSIRDGNYEIYTMSRDGLNVLRLTHDGATAREPVFSPDGTQILFSSDRDGDFELYIIDRDGTNLKQLTANATRESQPAFLSPLAVGKNILFTSDRTGNSELYMMSCSGTDTSYITACDAATIKNLTLHASADIQAAPSP